MDCSWAAVEFLGGGSGEGAFRWNPAEERLAGSPVQRQLGLSQAEETGCWGHGGVSPRTLTQAMLCSGHCSGHPTAGMSQVWCVCIMSPVCVSFPLSHLNALHGPVCGTGGQVQVGHSPRDWQGGSGPHSQLCCFSALILTCWLLRNVAVAP